MRLNEKLEREKCIVIEGSRMSGIRKERLTELIDNSINWEKVFEYAMRNKVLYVLYHNIKKCELDMYIPDFLKKLVEDSMKCNEIRNSAKFFELERICIELEKNNIRIVPVKGAYLIDKIYQNRAIRTTNDIDALIYKKDISKVDEIMKKFGYSNEKYDKLSKKFIKRSSSERMLYKTKMYNLLPYVKIENDPFDMEVVFDFSHSLDFDLSSKPIQEMIESSHLEKYIRKMPPEYYFIHMCCHHYREASHVEWMKIGKDLNFIKFCDIREFILCEMNEKIWKKALAFAKKHNIEKSIYFVLYYLNIIYSDGYENKWMQELEINNDSFVYMFGDDAKEKIYVRRKKFWDSFFDNDNSDEIVIKPKYNEVIQ